MVSRRIDNKRTKIMVVFILSLAVFSSNTFIAASERRAFFQTTGINSDGNKMDNNATQSTRCRLNCIDLRKTCLMLANGAATGVLCKYTSMHCLSDCEIQNKKNSKN